MQGLRELLYSVQSKAGPDFSGVGVLVCDEPENIPIYPLRPLSVPRAHTALDDYLAEISTLSSEFHDGFHVISTQGQLLKVAQYFSPPIVSSATIDYRRRFGGRYLAALFGSALSPVSMAGIASHGFGIALFRDGIEVHFEDTA
ncbi:hypothetical protein EKH79_03565 [Dyella dinghuensis]|uniref:DAC domain-containing protein n=1 Tax=Dyella dinghuensis TaxID=1920169 RepID=A0A3S0WQ51_9GAMM|nr:hypothetical protein [Dyella dinghuensis]RUL65802.1 hypothetical protein EKH79_03565 [Dyella dinghuensis]